MVPDAAGRKAGKKAGQLSGEKLICAIHHYAWDTYGRKIEEMRDRCPYNLDLGSEVYVRRQLVTWFASKWINPDTGETVVDEYVRAHVHDIGIAARILQVKELIHDEFRVAVSKPGYYKVISAKDGTLYKLRMVGDSSFVSDAEWFEGQIFPEYPVDMYRTCGVVTATMGGGRFGKTFSAHAEDNI